MKKQRNSSVELTERTKEITLSNEWRKHLQEQREKYKADSSPERFTEEETRMLHNIFRRRKDGNLSIYAEHIEAINDARLGVF